MIGKARSSCENVTPVVAGFARHWTALPASCCTRARSSGARLEASRGETKLVAWVPCGSVKHRWQIGTTPMIDLAPSVGQVVTEVVPGVGEELQPVSNFLQ